ncbi:MAG TPA: Asp23/Gls24 family envelope stress response protein [Clostridiales bacterium]|nr:MAG: alkaline-shock protein [Clostridiales bacterium GWD2_32_19]HCC06672.1 Asp23/Gls24 family envelope stress response protein [Clostridiales bacterium]
MFAIFENEAGKIIIDKEVIAKIAGVIAMGCYGVVGMASRNIKDGFVKLLGFENLTRGIEVEINDNKINIKLHIIVEYGTNISAIGESLISTVKYKLEQLIGLEVENINLLVEGLRVE